MERELGGERELTNELESVKSENDFFFLNYVFPLEVKVSNVTNSKIEGCSTWKEVLKSMMLSTY